MISLSIRIALYCGYRWTAETGIWTAFKAKSYFPPYSRPIINSKFLDAKKKKKMRVIFFFERWISAIVYSDIWSSVHHIYNATMQKISELVQNAKSAFNSAKTRCQHSLQRTSLSKTLHSIVGKWRQVVLPFVFDFQRLPNTFSDHPSTSTSLKRYLTPRLPRS